MHTYYMGMILIFKALKLKKSGHQMMPGFLIAQLLNKSKIYLNNLDLSTKSTCARLKQVNF